VANVAVKMGNRKGKIGKKVESGCWILDIGMGRLLEIGILDTGYWILDKRYLIPDG